MPSRRRRILRRLAIAAAGLAGLVVVVVLAAVFVFQGKTLASIVSKVLPPMRGKIEIKAVRWKARALIDLVTDRPTPVIVEGLRVTDPEGAVVLEAPRLQVKVRARSAIGGKIFLHDLEIGPGSLWRFAALKKSEDNGFLSAFQPAGETTPVTPPPRAPGEPPPDPFSFQIVNASLDGLTAVFDFPAWGLELRNVKGPVWLTVDGDFVGWDGTGLDARDGGFLRILQEVLPFDHVLVNRVATTREWPDSIFLDVGAARTGRSTLTAKGYFTEIYGYGYDREPDAGIDLHGEIADAADALSAVARAHALPGLRIGGKGARVVLDLKQPFARLAIAARVSGLDVAFGEYQAQQLALRASVVTDPLQLTVDELTFGAPGGGRLTVGAELAGTAFKTRLRFDRFTTTSYVPAPLRRLAAGKLTGRIGLAGDFGEDKRLSVAPVEISLVRAKGAAKLPGQLRVKGHASASRQRISTEGITFEIPGASAQVRGEINLARKLFQVGLRASTSDLPRLLEGLGLQPLARGAALSIEAEGPFKSPRARGEVVVQGIGVPGLPEVPQLSTRFHLEDGTLHVDSLGGHAFGGDFEGRGQLQLFHKTIDRMLKSPVLRFELQGREVELATLLSLGWASGRVSFVASAEGPLDKLRARVQVPAGSRLNVFGSTWELGGVEVEADPKGVVVRTARLARPGGAQVEVEGRMEFGGPMSWRVAIRDVAIEGLPGLAAAGVPVSGRLSANLQAGGTLVRPTLAGSISFSGVKARGTRLGDGELVISQLGDDGILIKGNLFKRLNLEAAVTYGGAGTRVRGALAFTRLALEDFLPELADLGDGKGLATGRISIDVRPDAPLAVEARLDELQVSITREALDKDGKEVRQRIWLRNAGVLAVAMHGERVVLQPARLVTDGGEFRLAGELNGTALAGAVSGHLSLDLLQPFLRRQVSALTGDLAVDLKVGGTTTRPDLEGRLAIARPVRIQPVGAAPEVLIPSGAIRLTGDSVQLADLAVTIDESTLTLRGEARYDQSFQPTSFEVHAAGEVNASLLTTLAATAVSDARGRARIKAKVSGTPQAPSVEARIDLGEIELRLRSLGRLITLESGTVELTSKELVLRDVKTRIDDQGRLLIGAAGVRPGRIAIKSLYPTLELGRIDLPLKGERLTYRVPNSVEIDDLGFTLGLAGDLENGLALRGEVLIMSGRYVQDFQVQELVISPRIAESSARPFYEGNELLADLALDLRVRTVGDSFIVQNNLAPQIHVIVDLRVSGTLSEPRLAGNVRPTDGRFHILGLRGEFELTPSVNHITFVETKSLDSGDTPELNLEAQNVITDVNGGEHVVLMRIRGPVRQANIELSTVGGLDRNQTLLLLVSGRTNRDTARFGSTTNPTLGSNLQTGTDMVGQITRDTVGNLVEPYIDDTLQLLTGRHINLRPTVGVDGFELKLIARASRNTDLKLSYLRGFQQQQRYRGEGSLWLFDYVSARGYYEQLTLTPQQGISESTRSFNLELGVDVPLRVWWY